MLDSCVGASPEEDCSGLTGERRCIVGRKREKNPLRRSVPHIPSSVLPREKGGEPPFVREGPKVEDDASTADSIEKYNRGKKDYIIKLKKIDKEKDFIYMYLQIYTQSKKITIIIIQQTAETQLGDFVY